MSNYRLRFLYAATRFLLLPPILLNLSLRYFHPYTPFWARCLLYLASVPVFWTVRRVLHFYSNTLHAKQLGAQSIPIVQGKLPGNFDVMLRQGALYSDAGGSLLNHLFLTPTES
jgi:hypothetical protein